MDNVFPKRKWMRLRNYDYASQKVYFITLCTQNRERILSEIVGRGLDPSVRLSRKRLFAFARGPGMPGPYHAAFS